MATKTITRPLIQVVEDNKVILEMYRGFFKKKFEGCAEFDIRYYKSSEDALTDAAGHKRSGGQIFAAIIDINLPGGMNGVEYARTMLSFDVKTQIIFVSAFGDIKNDLKFIRQTIGRGGFLFYVKPVRKIELRQAVRTSVYNWELILDAEFKGTAMKQVFEMSCRK